MKRGIIRGDVLVNGAASHVSGICNRSRDAVPGSILVVTALELSLYDAVTAAAAVVCTSGGLTGHTQSLCRAKGIPVLRIDPADLDAMTGPVTLDLENGCVHLGDQPADAGHRLAPHRVAREVLGSVCVVIADLDDIVAINSTYPLAAESFFIREEFLCLTSGLRPLDALSGTEEDAAAYGTAIGEAVCRLVGALAPHQRIVLRLLDLRSDDAARISVRSDVAHEPNPELGLHGTRWLLRSAHYPHAFRAMRDHLHAHLPDAAAKVTLAVPFVNDAEEFAGLKARLAWGDMSMAAFIETPAAVYSAPSICAAGAAELFVGTKDLVQFYLAADRGNHVVAQSYRTRHPAVLDALGRLVESTHESGHRIRVFALGADVTHYVRNIPRPDGYMLCTAELQRLAEEWGSPSSAA